LAWAPVGTTAAIAGGGGDRRPAAWADCVDDLAGIEEIISTVHARRAPMMHASAASDL
jgi:hypothetical protein